MGTSTIPLSTSSRRGTSEGKSGLIPRILMDDLDRILWRSQLHSHDHLGFYDDDNAKGGDIPALQPKDPGIYCRDYWAEPLGSGNADLRNHGFETQCRRRLEERIINRYSQLADAVNYEEDHDLVYETAN